MTDLELLLSLLDRNDIPYIIGNNKIVVEVGDDDSMLCGDFGTNIAFTISQEEGLQLVKLSQNSYKETL